MPRKACQQLGYLGDTYAKYSIEPASSFSLNSVLLNVSENLTPNCLPLFSHQSFPLLVESKQVAYRVSHGSENVSKMSQQTGSTIPLSRPKFPIQTASRLIFFRLHASRRKVPSNEIEVSVEASCDQKKDGRRPAFYAEDTYYRNAKSRFIAYHVS